LIKQIQLNKIYLLFRSRKEGCN